MPITVEAWRRPTGEPDQPAVVDNGDGTVTLTGYTVTDNGDGTVTTDAPFTDNGDGTVTLEAA